MGIKEKIKALIAQEASSLTKIAGLIYETEDERRAMNSLSQKFRLKTIRYDEIEKIADVLGYDIKFEKRK